MNEGKRLIKNTIIIAIGGISTKLITFLLLPFYTLYLTTVEYGTYDYICNLVWCLVPMTTMLMDESMFRFLIDAKTEEDKKEVVSNSLVIQLLGMILGVFICFIIIKLFNNRYSIGVIIYYLACCLPVVINPILRGQGNFVIYTLYNSAISLCVAMFFVIGIFVLEVKVTGLLIANALAHIFVSAIIAMYIGVFRYVSLNKCNKNKMSEMFFYSLPLIPNRMYLMITAIIDRFMIVNFLGIAYVGLFAVADKISQIIGAIYGFFATSWQESASRVVKEVNNTIFYTEIYNVTRLLLSSILIALIAYTPLIFKYFISYTFNGSIECIPVLLISVYYYCLAVFFGGILTAIKDTKSIGEIALFAMFSNIIIGILLIKEFGLNGIAISHCVTNYMMFYLRKKNVRKHFVINTNKDLSMYFILFIVLGCFYQQNFGLKIISCVISSTYLVYVFYKIGVVKILIRKLWQG